MRDRVTTFDEWLSDGWTPRARRLAFALIWTILWLLVFHGLGSVLTAQSSAGESGCRSTSRPCVAMAPLGGD